MGVAVHSDVAAAIRSLVSQAAIRLGVSRVAVTAVAGAADKSQDILTKREDHLILSFVFPVTI